MKTSRTFYRYQNVALAGGKMRVIHRILVERICKIKLETRNQIHHRDGNGRNNDNTNLIVCEDEAYHRVLEYRTAAYRASGNAHYKQCDLCRQWDDEHNLTKTNYLRNMNDRARYRHTKCNTAYQREWRKRRDMRRVPNA